MGGDGQENFQLWFRTLRSKMLARPAPKTEHELEERKDVQARMRAELDQMKAKHKPPDDSDPR